MKKKANLTQTRGSNLQFYGSITGAPLMTIAGLYIGYYGGESIQSGMGTIGAFFGAFLFFFIGLLEIFNIGRKEAKKVKNNNENAVLKEIKDSKYDNH